MRHLRRVIVATGVLTLAASVGIAPASGDVPSKKKQKTLRVLVTNDDGVEGEGIDALVEALIDLPRVKVTVVAPAKDQTGQGDKTTPGELTASETALISGYDATAVNGRPADSVIYALDELGVKPHVVVSGINAGQNLGPAADQASGTVGAAKTAVRRGIPALAVSQGFGEPPDYEAGVQEAIKWIKSQRKRLARGNGDEENVVNLNIPTCTVGEVRGLIEDIPLATPQDPYPAESNCESTLEDPAHDQEAFANGFATLTDIPAD